MKRTIVIVAALFVLSVGQAFSLANIEKDSLREMRASARPLNFRAVIHQIGYPKKCRKLGIEGVVEVKLLVSESGMVREVVIVDSPDAMFSQSCLNELTNLKFSPAVDDEGNAIESWVSFPITFELTI